VKIQSVSARILSFIDECRLQPDVWRYSPWPGGPETLYASCFACMLYHYLGRLETFTSKQKQEWANYLNSWQDPQTGLFIGPEIVPEELMSPKHDLEHVTMHLTAHVLPTLDLLKSKPPHSLSFAHRFLDPKYLQHWLKRRDWQNAWLEGNNLLFIGQFLIHLRDVENSSSAQAALDLYFEWLDQTQDPHTGLWGTNGFCSNCEALYGGYHQLLVYYFEDRPVKYPKRLIDIALSLQHTDGGFNPAGGGGACQNVDAIDILLNMYKRTDYKRASIRSALRKSSRHILKMQMSDGGFVYRLNESFMHMGIQKTASGRNQANLFPTWFCVHTLALISEILTDGDFADVAWQFNNSCSMGWHREWDKNKNQLTYFNKAQEVAFMLKDIFLRIEGIFPIIRRILPKQMKDIAKRLMRHKFKY